MDEYSQQKKKILLVDGMNLVKRCYFAIPMRHNHEGLPTNVIYGFMRTLINENSIFNFDGIFAVFDTPTSSNWRKEIYPAYKANRKLKTEKDFQDKEIIDAQLEHLIKILKAANVTVLANKKHEADDIIASLAEMLKEDHKVYILSSDKDLLQLVDKNVYLIRPKQGNNSVKTLVNLQTFKNLYPELENPERIFDLKVLTGDSSDNISGLTRVGDKTGLKMLAQYKSVENMLSDLDSLDEKTKKLIESDMPTLEVNQRIIKLIRNIEIPEERRPIQQTDFRNELMNKYYNYYNSNPWKD